MTSSAPSTPSSTAPAKDRRHWCSRARRGSGSRRSGRRASRRRVSGGCASLVAAGRGGARTCPRRPRRSVRERARERAAGAVGAEAPRARSRAPRRGCRRGAVDPRTLGVAVRSALEALAAEAPLVLAVDDVQWLDPSSASALAFALRRLREQPILLLLARRLGDRSGTVGARAGDRGATRVERLPVGPLSLGAMHRLLQGGSAGSSRGRRFCACTRSRAVTRSTRSSSRGLSDGGRRPDASRFRSPRRWKGWCAPASRSFRARRARPCSWPRRWAAHRRAACGCRRRARTCSSPRSRRR